MRALFDRTRSFAQFCPALLVATILMMLTPLTAADEPAGMPAIPAVVTPEGAGGFEDDRLWLRDYLNVMHGIFMTGGISRSSEMGHGNYRAELAGEPMAQRGGCGWS